MKDTVIEFPKTHTIRVLSQQEQKAGDNVVKNCMGIKTKESVLIVTDKKRVEQEAAVFYESAKKFSDTVTLVQMPTGTEHGQEPPEQVASMMSEYDVSLLVTTFSLSHTQARKKACEKGARIASMPGITMELILRTLILDYNEIAALTKKIAKILTGGKNATITSPEGTNIKLSLQGRTAIADTGIFTQPGDFGNLPAGEAFIAPVEGTANGVIVFDGCFGDIPFDTLIIVEVEKGNVIKITGGKAADELKMRLEKIGPHSRNIAELGIGTNKNTKLGKNLLELEKVYGTCHIALGNNATFGGTVEVPFHSDGVLLNPIVTIDNTNILKNNELL